VPKIINNDDFEFMFGSRAPAQSVKNPYAPNLPPEYPSQLPDTGTELQDYHGRGQSKVGIKPVNLHDPDDFECAVKEVLSGIKDRENSREITRKAAEKELGGTLSRNLTEQDVKNIWKRGMSKDTPELIAAIEKEMKDPNLSEVRRAFFKRMSGQ
jgi:hypothetical protein